MRMSNIVPWRRESLSLPLGLSDFDTSFTSLQRDINRLFENAFGRSGFEGGELAEKGVFSPNINLVENTAEYTLTAELPGMTEKDIEITVTKDKLEIKGEKKKEETKEEETYTYYESTYGMFHRVIPLGVAVDEEKIEARMVNGVLTVHLPKREITEKQAKKIAIQH